MIKFEQNINEKYKNRIVSLFVPKHMTDHNRSVTYLVSFNTIENSTA